MYRSRNLSSHKTNANTANIKNPFLGSALILLIGLLFLYFLTLPKVSLYFDSKNWVEVSGWVKESSVSTHLGSGSRRHSSSSDKTTYSINIYYSYNFNGMNYESNTYSFSSGGFYNQGEVDEIVKRHPPGTVIKCYINPKDPSQSVLSKEFKKPYLIFLIISPFLFIGFGAMFLVKEFQSLKASRSNVQNREENWEKTKSQIDNLKR